MQTAYFEAVVNRRHRVLGRALDDFCLYHVQALTLADNPLWLAHREPAAADLVEAVLICSLPPERLLRAELAPRHWFERLRVAALHRRARHDPDGTLAAFIAYLEDYESLPQLWDATNGKGREIKGPWILSLACFIEIHSNMREREIMTAPYGYIRWKAEAIAERLGVNLSEIMSEEEIAMGAEQRAAMAESGETFPDVPPASDDEDEIGGS